MRNGCKVVVDGKIGIYEKILPSGRMLVRFGREKVSVDLKKIKPAERMGDLTWIDFIAALLPQRKVKTWDGQ